MAKILRTNAFILSTLVITICYILSFISTDIVLSDKVYGIYLDDQYEKKYNEYKELDVDLSEFEDELAQFENDDDNSYDWGSFYIDSLFVVIPLLVVVISFSCTFLLITLFKKSINHIKYKDLFKTTILAYLVFYLQEIISGINFLIINRAYEFKDIGEFESKIYLSSLFDKDVTPNWLWEILSDTSFFYLIFPLVVALLLKSLYPDLRRIVLIGNAYFTYLVVFVFYNTIFWYLFDLV